MTSTTNATIDLVNVEGMMELVVPIVIGFFIINIFIWIWRLIRNAGMLEGSGEYNFTNSREDEEEEVEKAQEEIQTFREELKETPKKKSKQEVYDEWYKRKYLD